ncbi:MAG TPA: hypothetical protein V6D37_08415 [Candidatus Sericytochromatia bacterium]|jgi:hypothetical protein
MDRIDSYNPAVSHVIIHNPMVERQFLGAGLEVMRDRHKILSHTAI